jgi:hypothetical protein
MCANRGQAATSRNVSRQDLMQPHEGAGCEFFARRVAGRLPMIGLRELW